MSNAFRDQNSVPTLLGVSMIDGVTPVPIWADPVTHRLLVDGAGGGGSTPGGVTGSIQWNNADNFDGFGTYTPDVSLSTLDLTDIYGSIKLKGLFSVATATINDTFDVGAIDVSGRHLLDVTTAAQVAGWGFGDGSFRANGNIETAGLHSTQQISGDLDISGNTLTSSGDIRTANGNIVIDTGGINGAGNLFTVDAAGNVIGTNLTGTNNGNQSADGVTILGDGFGTPFHTAGIIQLDADETPDGVVTVFTFSTAIAEPAFVVVDGLMLRATSASGTVNWTWDGGLLQATMTVPPQDDVFAFT